MRITGICLFILLLITSCGEKKDHKGKVPLVEIEGNFLYQEDLDAALPANLSEDDSLLFASGYIRSWIEDVLMYNVAESNIPDDGKIDQLTENYRRSLIIHTYQQELINQRLSQEISEEEMLEFYEKNRDLFIVDQPLIKGLFIKVPLTTTGINNVRKWYKKNTPENVEALEKYSLNHAVIYDYFYDKWTFASDVIDKIPQEKTRIDQFFKDDSQIEVKDSSYYYFLNVQEYLATGDQKPFEFARNEIKEILINLKRTDFIRNLKDDLYKRAQKKKEINYFY